MPLSPPLCLLVYYNGVGPDPLDPTNPNLYNTTLTITPQSYSTGQYDGTTLTVGMWTTDAIDGYVFRIQHIYSQTSGSVNLTLEDVSGYNALIDPTGGLQGGGSIHIFKWICV